ncbi:MAG: DDE-type integrase/transposase/recombinase [Acidimicrobiales bacterium]|jgi:IS1 family transposase
MNRLGTERRAQVIGCLVEGMSIRATVRVTGVAKNTIVKLLCDLGAACSEYQDGVFNNLDCKVVECDEIWSFCYSKQKNVPEEHKGTYGYGDVWTWAAIDADTKLVPSWLVGERTMADAYTFLADLKSRLRNARIQLTTDGLGHYLRVVDGLWADNIDYAMLHKLYGGTPDGPEHTYFPAKCAGIEIKVIAGDPDPSRISTSYVERQNLTMRMGMRRFTRLTNAFSKKVENLTHAVSLHFMYYNLCRIHESLTVENAGGSRTKRTPAMAAGIAKYPWSLTQLAGLLD